MDGTTNLGNLLGSAARDVSSNQQTQSLTIDPGPSYFIFANYGQEITNTKILIEWQNVRNAFILGSSTNGILGTSVLGSLNMIWGNTGSLWGVVSWGGSLPAYSTIYENDTIQTITNLSKPLIAAWFAGTALAQPNYVALGIGNQYFDTFDTTTYKG